MSPSTSRNAVALALSLLLLPSLSAASWLNAGPEEARMEIGVRAVREANPMITPGPEIRDYRALAARASTINANTCGFIDGNANDWISCNNNNKCTVTSNGVGCCNAGGCGGWVSTCYDYTAVGTNCQTCTSTDIAYCSSKAYAWCATYYYPNGVLDFLCTTAPQTDHMLYTPTTTFAPQNHDQPIPTIISSASASGTSKATTSSLSGLSSSRSASSSSSTASSARSSSTTSTTSASSTSTTSAASSTTASSSRASSTTAAATTTAAPSGASNSMLVSFAACVLAIAGAMLLL